MSHFRPTHLSKNVLLIVFALGAITVSLFAIKPTTTGEIFAILSAVFAITISIQIALQQDRDAMRAAPVSIDFSQKPSQTELMARELGAGVAWRRWGEVPEHIVTVGARDIPLHVISDLHRGLERNRLMAPYRLGNLAAAASLMTPKQTAWIVIAYAEDGKPAFWEVRSTRRLFFLLGSIVTKVEPSEIEASKRALYLRPME